MLSCRLRESNFEIWQRLLIDGKIEMMKRKILIIEDEKILAEMYKEKFEMEGFEVF